MIRLDRLELLHWDIQAHQELPLAKGVGLITGENGSGKTSILDALKVGLGALHLGGDRTIDGYLLRQAQPVAMIRVLVDNRRDERNRRRPFDALGAYGRDAVTLAVVFRQEEERQYRRDYYILDGDVRPLEGRETLKPLGSRSEFQRRLDKVGIGKQYLKLLCLPQGRIASLCDVDGAELFDALYDIIGGKTTLEAWEEKRRALAEVQSEEKSSLGQLSHAKSNLATLQAKVRRYEAWRAADQSLRTHLQALPFKREAEAREEARRLNLALATADADAMSATAAVDRARTGLRATEQSLDELEAALQVVEEEFDALDAERTKVGDALARAEAQLAVLEKLRETAVTIEPRSVERLAEHEHNLRTELAAASAQARARGEERALISEELAKIDAGLMPFPVEVDAFRAVLRNAGIVHHVLAEVVEVEDEAWTSAVEGYLGRIRFAVLVQNPSDWSHAGELAREHRYPHGVLAPDYRGRSKSDAVGLTPLVRVGEARYASLVARLLRHVQHGEPPAPLTPMSGLEERLAADGFVVSRLEARHSGANQHFLGRDAMERRRKQLETRLATLAASDAEYELLVADKEARIRELMSERERQGVRLRWEADKDRWAELRERCSELKERRTGLDAARAALRDRSAALARDRDATARAHGSASERVRSCQRQVVANQEHRAELRAQKEALAERLGEILAQDLGTPDEETLALVNDGELSAGALQRIVKDRRRELDNYSSEERNPDLVVNHQRLEREVEVVEDRLGRLRERLEATRRAAEQAHELYKTTTRRVFRSYFGRLKRSAAELAWSLEGRLEDRENGRFACLVRLGVDAKAPVRHDSEDLSGGQKAALSILMGMTAVSLEGGGAGFFLIDEPFSASDVVKINELGTFLAQTGAQYLLSMPTTSDLQQCGPWLQSVWTCTRSRGGFDAHGRPVLAPPVRVGLTKGAREVDTAIEQEL